ncbi:MAG TPA: hypothetical protein VH575_04585 [Gemmataceae bacterium]|jgi:hypothetical protein
MRVRFWLPAVTSATLALIGFSAGHARAGSFFGPNCYGADYAYEYPNRAHNVFGFGPCTQCQAHHPLFKHRWARKHPNGPNDGAPANAMTAPNGMPANGMPANGMPANGMPANGMPANGMPANVMMTPNGTPSHGVPVEYVQAPDMQHLPVVQKAPIAQSAPVAQAPVAQIPAQPTSGTMPAPVQTIPAASSRVAPIPAPLPKGPAAPKPPAEEPSGKPPF